MTYCKYIKQFIFNVFIIVSVCKNRVHECRSMYATAHMWQSEHNLVDSVCPRLHTDSEGWSQVVRTAWQMLSRLGHLASS